MKFPVLWLASVSLSVWVGTEKGVRLAWDLVSRSRISLHFGAKAEKPKPKPNQNHQFVRPCNHVREAFRAMFEEMVVEVTHR